MGIADVLSSGEKIKGMCDFKDKERGERPFCEVKKVDKEGNVVGKAEGFVGMTKEGKPNLVPPVNWDDRDLKDELQEVVSESWEVVGQQLKPKKQEFEIERE